MACWMIVAVTIATQVAIVLSSAGNHWTYRGELGPEHWHMDYPHCGGIHQSPIDIISDDVIVDDSLLAPLEFNGYDDVFNVNYTLGNNGHTVQVDLNLKTMEVSGGGLPDTYVAQQFHFHWGADDSRGSEHSLNGRRFPMEMHVVHYNKKYGNFSQAVDKAKDGLVVLGFFFTIGRFNEHFQEIISHFNEIKYKDHHVPISSIPLVQLMPARLDKYYRYMGSLTTPPCYESVIWTIFNETIEIAEYQLENFRTMIYENDDSDGGVKMDISDDYRPVQCLFRRRVYVSDSILKPKVSNVILGGNNTGATSYHAARAMLLGSLCIAASCILRML